MARKHGVELSYRIFPSDINLTRMTTFIKVKLNNADEQTNIYKYREAANTTEYHIISKLILLSIIILKFIIYSIATLTTFNRTVLGIII